MHGVLVRLLVPGLLATVLAVGAPDHAGAQVDTTLRFASRISVDSTAKAGEVSGTVVSAQSGEPLASARLIVRNERDHRTVEALTDRDGHFRVVTHSLGASVLRVLRVGYRQESLNIDTREGVIARVAMRYNPPSIGECKNLPPGSICQ